MAVYHALAADLLLINGRVLTMDVHDSVAQAVAVRDGKIVAVGTNAEVEPLVGASTQVIDLDGRTAMPGLNERLSGNKAFIREDLRAYAGQG